MMLPMVPYKDQRQTYINIIYEHGDFSPFLKLALYKYNIIYLYLFIYF